MRAILVISEVKRILIILKVLGALSLAILNGRIVSTGLSKFPRGGYNNMCPSWNQMDIQNLIVGLVGCGEIFVFINYSDNQMARLLE